MNLHKSYAVVIFAILICLTSIFSGCTKEKPEKEEAKSKPKQDSYTITLGSENDSNMSVSPKSITLKKGTQVEQLPYAKLAGMRFCGWSKTKDAGGPSDLIDNSNLSKIDTNKNITLYPYFEPKPAGVDTSRHGLPIMMYHQFYDPNQGETGKDANWMNLNLFKEHLGYLRDNNYYFPSWDEVSEYINGDILLPEKSIVLTSDDGDDSFFRLAAPLAKEYKAKLTSFIIGTYFNKENIKRVDENFVEFQSHSYDMHRAGPDGKGRILTLSPEEIAEDTKQFNDIFGTSKTVFCYPYGHTNENAIRALADSGIKIALVIDNKMSYPLMNPLNLPRLRMNDGTSLQQFIKIIS